MRAGIALLAFVWGATLQVQSAPLNMLADIQSEVPTEFGVYHPNPVHVIPAVAPYVIAEDFSNVVNFSEFTFTAEEAQRLRNNGFVATPSTYKEMYDVYNAAKKNDLPIFLTVDALLHAYHELFDYTLRTLESRIFLSELDTLTSGMLIRSLDDYQAASLPSVREAARGNAAYFAVAARLLDSSRALPPEVADLVAAEMALIDAHAGIAPSPIFGYMEDYSQYIPRGHYTLSEDLKRFFRAMMWYGRMIFHAEENGIVGVSPEMARKTTRRALLLVRHIDTPSTESSPLFRAWERIYLPTTFFVGKTEDLSSYQYVSLGRGVFGSPLSTVPLDDFGNDDKIEQFQAAVKKFPPPAIAPEWGIGFRFMGQRFIPDSYMFTQLVYDRTSRFFPKGLDVMAVLGSDRAYTILSDVYHETDDAQYVAQMAALKKEFAGMPEQVWTQNLYWNWLYSLMPMLAVKAAGFPSFMQSPAWLDKDLNTALGSWAELRHDTILYAKQSYSLGTGPTAAFEVAYVEPNPWAFARLASLTRLTLDGLRTQELLLEEFAPRLEDLHALLLSLQTLAEKELANRPLTVAEVRRLRGIGYRLAWLTIFDNEHPMLGDALDDDMAIIADVHTDLTTQHCLEVGVGHPLNLYVLVPLGENPNELVVATGSAFSYCEFTWPVADRLTDEAWKVMITGDNPPLPPEWTGTFLDLSRTFQVSGSSNAINNMVPEKFATASVVLQPSPPRVGDVVTIRATLWYLPEITMMEAVCGTHRTVVTAVHDPDSPDPGVFLFTLDTRGWTAGKVELSFFDPGDLSGYISTDSFDLVPAEKQGVFWTLY